MAALHALQQSLQPDEAQVAINMLLSRGRGMGALSHVPLMRGLSPNDQRSSEPLATNAISYRL